MELIDPFSLDFWLLVGASLLCGGIIGLERQYRGKPAGVRTSTLICLGTAMFTFLGQGIQGENADPTRVVGQVITGIGFLGAGVIIARDGLVKGVTSAAVIWVMAAIGAMIGFEQHLAAITIAVVTVGVLVGVQVLEDSFRFMRQGVHAHTRRGEGEDDDPDRRARRGT